VSNTKLHDFRMVLAQTTIEGAQVALSAQELALLHCQAGDTVRTLSLNVRKNNG
jgi:arginine N-succinyltransferase